jgi:hypothetical protein
MDKELYRAYKFNADRIVWLANHLLLAEVGLQEAISDLNFIRTATNDVQIAALAEAASAVATCYLKQAKGEQ